MKTHARAAATSALVLGLVFVSGTLVGRAWDERGPTVGSAGEPPEAQEESREEQAEGGERRRRSNLYERVGLDDAQLVVIDSIVVHFRSDVRELRDAYEEMHRQRREEYDRSYGVLVDSVRQSIKSVMDADQRALYDSLLTAADQRRRERENDRAGGDDSGR